MAIKIPRGEIGTMSVGDRGSSMLSTVQSNKINTDKLTNTLSVVANQIKAHNLRIEEQRIDNKNTKHTSLLKADISDVIEKMKNDTALLTDGSEKSYEGFFKSEMTKLEKKYKDLYKGDEDALARWESIMYSAFNDGRANMRKERRRVVLADAQIQFNSKTEEFKKNLDNQEVTSNIWASTDLLIAQEKKRFETAARVGLEVDFEKYKKEVETAVWKKVVASGKQFTDELTGQIKVDYNAIYNELSAAKSNQKYFGKKLDDTRKEELMTWAKKKAEEEETIKENTHSKIDVENSGEINEILIQARTDDTKLGIPENVNKRDWIANKINSATLTVGTKKKLLKELDTIYPETGEKDTDTTTYGSNIALNEWYDQILSGGYKHGNKFKQSILQDERLTAKGKKWLIETALKYEKERDTYATQLVSEFMAGFDTTAIQGVKPELIPWISQNKHNLKRTLEEILAEGEAAGISIHAMLGDTTSPYYIGFKLTDIYSQSIMDIIGAKSAKSIKELMAMGSEQFFSERRDQAYALFFDADPKTEGNQLAFTKAGYETDKAGYVKALKAGEVDESQAIFLQRLLDKPMPPEKKWEGNPVSGGYESIESYIESEAYKKYRKDYMNWIKEGNFNSDKIPSFKKFFGEIDRPTTKIKN